MKCFIALLNSCVSEESSTLNSEGCELEFIRGRVRILTTEAGERPGASRGLAQAGVRLEAGQLRLCILRGDTWVWRSGQLDWLWRPDTSGLRSGLHMSVYIGIRKKIIFCRSGNIDAEKARQFIVNQHSKSHKEL